MGIPRDTALRGNMAYLVGDSSGVPDVIPDGLRLIDVADPMHPAQLRTVFLNEEPHRVVLAGDNALVLDLAGMKVIDVSEPATAHVIGKYAVPALGDPDAPFVVGGVDVAIAGDIAYLMADTLRILDLSRPSQPRTLSMIGRPGCCGWEVSRPADCYSRHSTMALRCWTWATPSIPTNSVCTERWAPRQAS